MSTHRFKQVDVFTSVALAGNPVAVVMDADDLSTERMQAFANWTNLSETTFVLRPTDPAASYRLRIFTPRGELPFAGHPTLGSAHALIESGIVVAGEGQIVQQCAVGLVTLHVEPGNGRIALELPGDTTTPISAAARADTESALGAMFSRAPMIVDIGPRWLTGTMADVATVRSLTPDMSAIAALARQLDLTGVNVFGRTGADTEVRSFAPTHGVPEDPVCGSGNGAVAVYLRDAGMAQAYVARQGRNLGRDGYVFVDFAPDGKIRLGGHAVTCIQGSVTL